MKFDPICFIYLYLLQNKMINRQERNSYRFQGAADDIKKGLERIKQAQIEVMRQLKKDDIELSRNHSLCYSRQTSVDNYTSNIKSQNASLRQKIQKYQKQQADSMLRENKLKHELKFLIEECKKNKQVITKLNSKMHEYETGEQKALSKAQQALAAGVASEKKYIQLKTQYDKILKEKERHRSQLKRLQMKEIISLSRSKDGDNTLNNKLIKEFKSLTQSFVQLIALVNSHKCIKKQPSSGSKNNFTNQHQSVNTFSISTYECQSKLDRHMNNIIVYLQNYQSPIQQISSQIYSTTEKHQQLDCEMINDIKRIEQQIQRVNIIERSVETQKLKQSETQNKYLKQKLLSAQKKVQEKDRQILALIEKNKALANQLETASTKNDELSRGELQKNLKGQRKGLFEKYKNLAKMSESVPVKYQSNGEKGLEANQAHKKTSDPGTKNYDQFEIFQDRIVDLERENESLAAQKKQYQQRQKKLEEKLQQLNQILETYKAKQFSSQVVNAQQINKKSMQIEQLKEQKKAFLQQKIRMQQKQAQIYSKLQSQSQKLNKEIQLLQKQLISVKKQLTQAQSDKPIKQNKINIETDKILQMWDEKQLHYGFIQQILKQFSNKCIQQPQSKANPTQIASEINTIKNFAQSQIQILPKQQLDQQAFYQFTKQKSLQPLHFPVFNGNFPTSQFYSTGGMPQQIQPQYYQHNQFNQVRVLQQPNHMIQQIGSHPSQFLVPQQHSYRIAHGYPSPPNFYMK